MLFDQKTPCRECPFRRRSLPGWLGASNPEEFLATTLADAEMPCHMTVDYEDPYWEDELDMAQFCAGALIFFRNICKVSRDRSRPLLPADKENVFATPAEFLAHHKSEVK
jgi:hypothetical protein